MIAEVIIDSTVKALNKKFDYAIPKNLEDIIIVGSRVYVPFANFKKLEEGYVIKIKDKSEYDVKEIAGLEENLTENQIELARYMARKYYCNVSECIKLMLTPGTRTKENRVKDKLINFVYLDKEREYIEQKINEKNIKGKKQIKVIKFIMKNEGLTIKEIEEFTECNRATITSLVNKGYLKLEEKKIYRNPLINKKESRNESLQLTEEQKIVFERVLEVINQNKYEEFLLYGVTGAGKTEVYLQLIEKVILSEKSAIVLVPEISLTPQMIDRFINRFGKDMIAVLHSKLSMGERHDEWIKIKENKAKIVIGARSAIFAPVKDLGIIIIDEEHDSSYKSESSPKYDAKEIARMICKNKNVPVLLGSATPDLNTFYKTTIGEITLLELRKRANNSNLPTVKIIDLKQELAIGNKSMLSNELYMDIEENIKNKRQTILFLNRRGYSTFIMCRDCGYTVKCKNCNISLTYHSFENKLKCHYCGYEERVVTICPNCNSNKIRYFGTGTQKLEQEINKQFPNARTIRMDVDTVTKKNSHEEILNKFKEENIDILIGTQMVVKGHHFPNVTLVGVIAADGSLNIDDYRANERTFQILTQVAGRAGRENLPGKVIIQTYNPDAFSIELAKEQNYDLFYNTEIELRKQLKYPPFCDIILINFISTNEQELKNLSLYMYKMLKQNLEKYDINIFQPMPSPIDKLQNKIRWRIIAKGKVTDDVNIILNKILKKTYELNLKNTKVSIDINPNSMM